MLIAHFLVTPRQIRLAVIPLLEESLNSRVQMEAVEVSLLSGIRVSRLSVADLSGSPPWFEAENLVLRYQLWPLLLQRIVIDEVRFERPFLALKREFSGRFTHRFLHARLQKYFTSSKRNPSAHPAETASVDLVISTVRIQEGTLEFRDYSVGAIPRLYRVTNVGAEIHEFSPSRLGHFQLWGLLNEAPFDLEGSLDLVARRWDLHLMADRQNPILFQPYYREDFPGQLNQLLFHCDLHLNASDQKLQAHGSVRLDDLDVLLPAFSPRPVQCPSLQADVDTRWDMKTHSGELTRCRVQVDGVDATLSGAYSLVDEKPVFDLECDVAMGPVRHLLPYLPADWTRVLRRYDPVGQLGASFSLVRSTDCDRTQLRQASFKLDTIQPSSGSIRPVFSGEVKIFGKQLTVSGLQMQLADKSLRCAVSCDDWLAERPLLGVDLEGDAISLRDWFYHPYGEHDGYSGTGSFSSPQTTLASFDARGQFSFGQVMSAAGVIEQVQGQFVLQPSQLRIQQLSGRFGQGRVDGEGVFRQDNDQISWRGAIQGRDLDLAALWQRRGEVPGIMQGRLDVAGQFGGTGWSGAGDLPIANGSWQLRARQGRFSGFPVQQRLGRLLSLTTLQVIPFGEVSAEIEQKADGFWSCTATLTGSSLQARFQARWDDRARVLGVADLYLGDEEAGSVGTGPEPEDLFNPARKQEVGLTVSGFWPDPVLETRSAPVPTAPSR
ncbi:MAG: DUF748 domain-containing protein [Desulfuromonadaceae bacterium]|nr:DUF748 domain-containing protein [Desulfuromonadaceae bacterium]